MPYAADAGAGSHPGDFLVPIQSKSGLRFWFRATGAWQIGSNVRLPSSSIASHLVWNNSEPFSFEGTPPPAMVTSATKMVYFCDHQPVEGCSRQRDDSTIKDDEPGVRLTWWVPRVNLGMYVISGQGKSSSETLRLTELQLGVITLLCCRNWRSFQIISRRGGGS